jgi:hypothetical protein
MPLPDGVATVTLTAVFPPLSPDGADRQGTAVFTPVPPVLVDPGGIYLGPENATIGASGLHVQLVATDALADAFVWRMDLALTGQPPISRNISLPASAGNVSLGTVLEVEPLPTDYVVVIGPRGPQGADGGASGPTGPAGGALAGTYPDPTLSAGSVALFDAAGAAASAQAAAISTAAADATSKAGAAQSTAISTAASDATTKANAAQAAAISAAASDATSKVSTHSASTTSVHGIADTAALETQSGAASKVSAHAGGTDSHGDRAYADNKFATLTALGTTNSTVTTLGGAVTDLDGFVQDCLTRVSAIEQGTAFLAGLNVAGPAQVSGGNLTVTDFTKGYRFRVDGSSLDLEATGTDLILSNWSGSGFNGTQRSYLRLSADAQNIQVAGKVEYVDALYGATKHVLDGTANTAGFFGATPTGRPTVTGSRGGNAALASLITALATLGLVTDSTTA